MSNSSVTRSFTPLALVGLSLLVAAGVFFRTRYFGFIVGPDEAYTYLAYGSQPWLVALGKYNLPDNHVLNSLLIHIVRLFRGDDLISLRLPVFIAGTVAIAASGWMALKIFEGNPLRLQLVALATAGFTAFSFRMIHYSIEARGYMIEVALFLITVVIGRHLMEEENVAHQRFFIWLSALGLLAVPTHLYAFASLAVWLGIECYLEIFSSLGTAKEKWRQTLLRVFGSHVRAVSLAVCLYAPVIFYVATHGTKIEPKENLHDLPRLALARLSDLRAYWLNDHPASVMIWIACGLSFSALIFPRRKTVIPLIGFILGPALIILLTRRPAPFARVWTYCLPVFFAFAAEGWSIAVAKSSERLRFPFELRAPLLVLFLFAPLVPTATFSWRKIRTDVVSFRPHGAERAWEFMRATLKPGDHVGFDSQFYDQVRFIARTARETDFVFDPLARKTEGTITVLEQSGREIRKTDPLAKMPEGNVYMYAFQKSEIDAMEQWLKPYVPEGTRLVQHTVFNAIEENGGESFPKAVRFELQPR